MGVIFIDRRIFVLVSLVLNKFSMLLYSVLMIVLMGLILIVFCLSLEILRMLLRIVIRVWVEECMIWICLVLGMLFFVFLVSFSSLRMLFMGGGFYGLYWLGRLFWFVWFGVFFLVYVGLCW